jgi:hypothetical protein
MNPRVFQYLEKSPCHKYSLTSSKNSLVLGKSPCLIKYDLINPKKFLNTWKISLSDEIWSDKTW